MTKTVPRCLNLFKTGEWQKDPDPVFKILIGRIRPKMDRIRNPSYGTSPQA